MTADTLSTSSLLPEANHDNYYDEDQEDEEYQAIMSDLPTIVSMAGFFEGEDFDELNEVQNLLAPPEADSEQALDENPSHPSADGSAQNAYIQSLVPNPIPAEEAPVYPEPVQDDIVATVAALDEDLGFPTTSFMVPAALPMEPNSSASLSVSISNPIMNSSPGTLPNAPFTENVSLSVTAPAKRVYQQVEPATVTPVGHESPVAKKQKVGSQFDFHLAKTPAQVRTAVDGGAALNPLLFGRPIKLPSSPPVNKIQKRAANKPRGNGSPRKNKVKISQQSAKSSRPRKIKKTVTKAPTRPKLVIPDKALVPTRVITYSVPPSLNFIPWKKPPLCPLKIGAKMEAIVTTKDAALAPVLGPPVKKPLNKTSSTSSRTSHNTTSATASNMNKSKNKKVASSSKNKKKGANPGAVKPKKKASAAKIVKAATASAGTEAKPDVAVSKKLGATTVESKTSQDVSAPPSAEESAALVVANPLANLSSEAASTVVPPAPSPQSLVAAPEESQEVTMQQAKPVAKPGQTESMASTKPEGAISASVEDGSPVELPASSSSLKIDAATAEGTDLSAPAVVSSNNSAASHDDQDQNMDDPASSATSEGSEDKPSKSSKGRPLTKEERAQACRDRNRQHARNTRLRKKAYLEELKASLLEIVEERDRSLALEEEASRQKEGKKQGRSKILADFLQLHGHNEREQSKWEALVENSEEFQLTLPIVKSKDTAVASCVAQEEALVGLASAMAEADRFGSFLQSRVGVTKAPPSNDNDQQAPVHLDFHPIDTSILMDGNTLIQSWKASSAGAVSMGATTELALAGTVRAEFSPNDKLISVDLMYDTGAIVTHLVSVSS